MVKSQSRLKQSEESSHHLPFLPLANGRRGGLVWGRHPSKERRPSEGSSLPSDFGMATYTRLLLYLSLHRYLGRWVVWYDRCRRDMRYNCTQKL